MTAAFAAKVADGGYRVIQDPSPQKWTGRNVLLPRYTERPPREVQITEAALFLRFAELPTPLTIDAWVRFADQYGFLGGSGVERTDRTGGGDDPPGTVDSTDAETALGWETDIEMMRSLVSIWDALRNPSQASRNYLRQLLRTKGSGDLGFFFGLEPMRHSRKHSFDDSESEGTWGFAAHALAGGRHFFYDGEPGDDLDAPYGAEDELYGADDEAFSPEAYAVEDREARDFAAQGLAESVSQSLREGYTQALRFDEHDNTFHLLQHPPRLIDYLYLQFALAMESPPEFRRCASCNQWMAIGSGERTARAQFCNEACRQRGQRQRRKDAVAFSQDGLEPVEIAERLGISEKSVRGWIDASTRGKKK